MKGSCEYVYKKFKNGEDLFSTTYKMTDEERAKVKKTRLCVKFLLGACNWGHESLSRTIWALKKMTNTTIRRSQGHLCNCNLTGSKGLLLYDFEVYNVQLPSRPQA